MNSPNTPWLSTCDALITAIDWLCDVERIHGATKDQAIEEASAAFDVAMNYLDQLSDPAINRDGARLFAATRERIAEIAAPVRNGLPEGTRFRRIELRDIANQAHADRRRSERNKLASHVPIRAGNALVLQARQAMNAAAA